MYIYKWTTSLVQTTIILIRDLWVSTHRTEKAHGSDDIWKGSHPMLFLHFAMFFIFYLPHPHLVNLGGSRIFGNFEWVPLTIISAKTWLTKLLDNSSPSSPTDPIQSEPSQTGLGQNGPLNIPLVFLCKNCGVTLGSILSFGRTLKFRKCIKEVVCFCCEKKRQSGRFVSTSNQLTLWHLLRDRFMKSMWTRSWMLVTGTITF